MMLNPLRAYLAYRTRQAEQAAAADAALRQERRDERAAFLAAIQAMAAVTTHAFEASRAQTDTIKAFMDTFTITEPPQLRSFDEAADYARYAEAHGLAVPTPLAGSSQLAQFEALLDRLEDEH